jgi:hypothetical protein
MRHFQELVQAKALEIVDKWIGFFCKIPSQQLTPHPLSAIIPSPYFSPASPSAPSSGRSAARHLGSIDSENICNRIKVFQ